MKSDTIQIKKSPYIFLKTYGQTYFIYIIILMISMLFLANYLFVKQLDIKNGCSQEYATFIKEDINNNQKLTFCEKWNKDKIQLKTQVFQKKFLSFEYIGFPNDDNISLYLIDEYKHKIEFLDLKDSSEKWLKVQYDIPEILHGNIRLIADDSSVDTYGWLGISNLNVTNYKEMFKLNTYLQTFSLIILFSLFISVFYSCFLKKIKHRLEAYVYLSLFLGMVSLLTFYISLLSIYLGYMVSILLIIVMIYMMSNMNKNEFQIDIFILFFSMLSIIFFVAYSNYPDLTNIGSVSANKWLHLPVDNWIPKIFANAIINGHIDTPMLGDWLSSDRPPLQVGWFLMFGSYFPMDIWYLVTSVGAQLLVIVFLILFLSSYLKDKMYLFIVCVLLFFNGFVFVNALFVWPKLFSALYQGIAFYYLYNLLQSKIKSRYDFIGFGVSSTLAFLAHGGSIFYLLSLSILLLLFIKSKQDIKNLFLALFFAIVLYIPWVIYQKMIDPPGDRLLKWHLANQHKVTDESFLFTFIEYYHNLTFRGWLELRFSHISHIFKNFYSDLFNIVYIPKVKLLNDIFLSLEYSYLFFSVVFLLFYWVGRKMNKEVRTFTRLLFFSFLLYILLWVLLLASETVIHQGAYFGWFSGFIGVTLVVYYISRYLFYLLSLLNLILFYKIYISPYLFDKDIISSSIFLVMSMTFILHLYLFFNKTSEEEV